MARLRAETGMLQRRVEHELAVFGDAASWLDYRLYLCRMYGFLVPVEAALDATPDLAAVVPDVEERTQKVALLARDLLSLGVDRRHLGQIPRIAVPTLAELPEALGWMYVVESATLDAAVLARSLADRLPAELEHAAAYLHCYGDEAHARWRGFGAAVEAYVDDADDGAGSGAGSGDVACDRIVLAATDCLFRFHRWLAPSSWGSSTGAGRTGRAGRVVA
jgi:heme oxygenase